MKFGKIKIHSSFLLFLLLVIAFRRINQFFLVILAVTAHEFAHAAVALTFGRKTESVLITPIGESARILGFETLSVPRKTAVLLAGPAFNIITALAIRFFFMGNEHVEALMRISAVIGVFNLLPVYPMDGGRLLFAYLGNRLGILNAAFVAKYISKLGTAVFFATGFIQLVLFPLNMSLLAVGVFLALISKRENASMIFSYYECMLNKRGVHKVKTAVYSSRSVAAEVERVFTWDFFHIIYVIGENGEVAGILTEKQIFGASVTASLGRDTKLLDIIDGDDI